MPNDNDTEAQSLNAPVDPSASTAGVQSVGEEVGPFRLTVEWNARAGATDEEKESAAAFAGKITELLNGTDNASESAKLITKMTIVPMHN